MAKGPGEKEKGLVWLPHRSGSTGYSKQAIIRKGSLSLTMARGTPRTLLAHV